MTQTKNPQPRARLRAQIGDPLASLITPENTPTVLQAQRLCRRFGISPTLAPIVAEHAYQCGVRS